MILASLVSLDLTMCQECAVGRFSSIEQPTACDGCVTGSVLVAQNVECQQCFSGQSECNQCSAVLNPGGLNAHLWTTMKKNELLEWRETPGSQSVSDCGCAAGAWVDALGQCQECGEGISCNGMGEVEVLPGYFASVDRPGFVWRCHGADWTRCP